MAARRAAGEAHVVGVIRAQQIKVYPPKDKVGIAQAKYRPFSDPSVRLRTRVVEVKARSETLRTDIMDGKRKLASVWSVVVLMDPARGAAVPLSDKLIEHSKSILHNDGYQAAIIPSFNTQDTESMEQLDKSGLYRSFYRMSSHYIVGISQIDFLGHVNQSRYCDWYDDMYYWVTQKANGESSSAEQQPDSGAATRTRALDIVKQSWPSTGHISRIEYDRETMPGTKITVQMRWIERVRDGAFVGFLFEALRRDSEGKVKTNNRAMHFFDKEAAGLVPQAKL
eukprot:TRINITY_DN1019_c0_g1_i2.p1 TRINITY_DN1019_c0_g1~~TRINITY_DN1019_c0_g1_i2.p1  ORF type:complete len:282 (+),score=53.18 TRINITY_DN1019_c0_g1_i2:496-1341(+)